MQIKRSWPLLICTFFCVVLFCSDLSIFEVRSRSSWWSDGCFVVFGHVVASRSSHARMWRPSHQHVLRCCFRWCSDTSPSFPHRSAYRFRANSNNQQDQYDHHTHDNNGDSPKAVAPATSESNTNPVLMVVASLNCFCRLTVL